MILFVVTTVFAVILSNWLVLVDAHSDDRLGSFISASNAPVIRGSGCYFFD